MDVEVRRCRIRRVHQVDQHAVTGQQPLAVIEGQIRCKLRPFPQPRHLFWGYAAVGGDMHLDASYRDGALVLVGVAPEVIGGLGIRSMLSGHRSGVAALGQLLAVPLTYLSHLMCLLQLLRRQPLRILVWTRLIRPRRSARMLGII
ncbi:hypothetical protein ACIBG0_28930 [Nocardia sp. NPDC050630]|uniref:hypothetical protein n=1 Tax=Nocardia sp. NPDC050630 TaxID=3364321 RepID=UPI00379F6B03